VHFVFVLSFLIKKNRYYLKIKTTVAIKIDDQFNSISDILSRASSQPNESSLCSPIISLILSYKLHIGIPKGLIFSDFPKETPYAFSPLQYLLHVSPISSLILSPE
jgi:hypothetical protein